ncbi:MAG: hypothetical protein IH627_19575 [Rubrivivax sp.]|nr:hypothetical protein [Rubrivivax sp.]
MPSRWGVSPDLECELRKNVIIMAAPFGYGPAAKALLIAQALSDVADVTLFSSGDAYRFLARYMQGPNVCREGVFQSSYALDSDLAPFDLFISVNNDPAVHHLVSKGLEARTVFVDSILLWRSANSTVRFRKPILAYLAQDFPGVASCLARGQAQIVELTAPMVWSAERIEAPGTPQDTSTARGGPGPARAASGAPHRHGAVTLHLGGLTSPLVSWEMLRRPIEEIFRRSLALTRRHGRKLTVVGSRNLGALAGAEGDDVTVLGDVSPTQAAALVGSSEVLLSTPGVGAVYEALACGVPTILLPPMNSTQLLQYGVLTDCGVPGSMHARARADLLQAGRSIPWDKQTAYSIRFLTRNLPAALAELPRQVERLLGDGGRGPAFEEVQRLQAAFVGALSKTSAVDIVRKVLLGERP